MSNITYTIQWLKQSPSMSHDKREFTGNFWEACAEARKIWVETGRCTSVMYRNVLRYFIDHDGHGKEYNG